MLSPFSHLLLSTTRLLSPRSIRPCHSQRFHTNDRLGASFTFISDFLSTIEQRTLLAASLQRLNETESALARRKRRRYEASLSEPIDPASFLPDEYYQFEEGHHDRVIRRYRETHLSTWASKDPRLDAIIDRLQRACPTQDTQTHLLHLASDGEILPHVDNLDASGSWIMGVSLGSARTLRMHPPDGEEVVSIELPPGSLYIQRDALRYSWKHSIERAPVAGNTQRLSVMLRDRKATAR